MTDGTVRGLNPQNYLLNIVLIETYCSVLTMDLSFFSVLVENWLQKRLEL